MRRRAMLTAVPTAAAVALAAPHSAAVADTRELLDQLLLLDRPADEEVPASTLRERLRSARAEFRAVRYRELAHRLPRLVHDAEAHRRDCRHDQASRAESTLAEIYALATELAIKLHEEGLAWTMADRALRAARNSADPTAVASAQRVLSIALRRSGHRDQAQQAILSAAHNLRADTGLADTGHARQYASLLATAAYTAAQADRRADAWTLVAEAETVLTRAAPGGGFALNDLMLYRVGVARALGDYGHAVDLVRRVRLDELRSPERQARYWEDAALSLMGRGWPDRAWQAVRGAQASAPQEVLYRPWVRQVTERLLDTSAHLPGLPGFAARIGVSS